MEKVTVLPGISDHDGIPLVNINIKPKINKSKPRKIYLYQKANQTQIKSDLNDLSLKFVNIDPNSVTTEQLWMEFSDTIKSSMEKNIPTKIISKRNITPWVNRKVKRSLKHKQRAYNHAKKSGKPEDWNKFRSMRRRVTKETRHSYRRYIKEVCIQGNKRFWTFIKGLRKDSAGIPALKNEDCILVTDNIKKAELLNKQFKSVFTQEDTDHLPQITKRKFPGMPEINVNVNGVQKLLSELNIHKATGPDDIPSRILKDYANEIAPALPVVFRKSLSTGELPESWRQANITPIFKKG